MCKAGCGFLMLQAFTQPDKTQRFLGHPNLAVVYVQQLLRLMVRGCLYIEVHKIYCGCMVEDYEG